MGKNALIIHILNDYDARDRGFGTLDLREGGRGRGRLLHHVLYRLDEPTGPTPLGNSFEEAMEELHRWADENGYAIVGVEDRHV
jgi:hypothetical protein